MSAPLVIIVGFLGAGKTTFLREILPLLEARRLRPFVIINDYANARIDASSLEKDGRTVQPINGNCICCDSVIELMNVLLEIPEGPQQVILLEANGTTDPTALLEHLLVNPELRRRFSPLLQVAIVDLQRWQKRSWFNPLERLQVETASHLLFTREESVPAERCAQVRKDIEWFNPKAEWIKRHSFAVALEKLVRENQHACGRKSGSTEIVPQDKEAFGKHSAAAQHHGQEHEHGHAQEHEHEHDHRHSPEHQHEHGHHDDRHQLSHAFVGLEIGLPDPMRAEHLQAWLKSLPTEVLRVKGVVRLAEEPDKWMQFQRVDECLGEATLFELPQKPTVPACAVLIGVRLDEKAIRHALTLACQK